MQEWMMECRKVKLNFREWKRSIIFRQQLIYSFAPYSYGDRSPRGFLARIFAIIWVLVGLVITSIFTGVVTTSLTAITLSTDVKLYGTKVSLNELWHDFCYHIHYHYRSPEEQSTVSRLQLARSWAVRTMSSSEKCLLRSIHSWTRQEKRSPWGSSHVGGLIQRVDVSGLILWPRNLNWRQMSVDSKGLVPVRS